jgi:hypothetical protein
MRVRARLRFALDPVGQWRRRAPPGALRAPILAWFNLDVDGVAVGKRQVVVEQEWRRIMDGATLAGARR